jgi:hypothetical protein
MSDQNPPVFIRQVSGLNPRSEFYLHRLTGGEMVVQWIESVGLYHITDIDVSLPRRGIGRRLLRSGQEQATNLGARSIVAAIISRECLESMVMVFGQEHISVEKLGDFVPEDEVKAFTRTSALLYVPLKPSLET